MLKILITFSLPFKSPQFREGAKSSFERVFAPKLSPHKKIEPN
jgi:hypothetical protein